MIPDATELVSIWRMSATWSQHYKGVTFKMSKVFKSTDGFSARKNMSEKYVEYCAYKVHIYREREVFVGSLQLLQPW